MSAWGIYLWRMVDDVRDVAGVASIMLLFLAACLFAASCDEFLGIDMVAARRWAKRCVAVGVVCVATFLLVPRSSTVALMWVVPRIVNSEAVKRDLPELYDLAVEALRGELRELGKKGGDGK